MLGACRKETYSSKLVLKDVVSGLPKVGRIPPGVPILEPQLVWGFKIGRLSEDLTKTTLIQVVGALANGG